MRRLVPLLLAVAVSLSVGCGDDETVCERICGRIRPDLTSNFNILPERIDCDDKKWKGDCRHCDQLIRDEFHIQPELWPECEAP